MLNDDQLKIVYEKSKSILVLAGAGSGKTKVIVERMNHLIKEGVKPEEILSLTFTKKAAEEMKKRSDERINSYTFHGYCYELLKDKMNFNVFEHNKAFSKQDLLEISNYKNSLKRLPKPKVYLRYKTFLKENHLLDFDDLLYESIPYIHQHKFKYIFIDEFQDTNLLQFKLLKKMIKSDTHVMAVGDPDQSIYAFRGAKVGLIDVFVKTFNAKVMYLNQNYRSTQTILDAANRYIHKNMNRYKKSLKSDHRNVLEPLIYIGNKSFQEQKIIELIRSIPSLDIAILYRNHDQGARIKQILNRNYLFFVSCMTLHESKGLEFDAVFIIGCEVIPHDMNQTYLGLEEERRLLFVGITRAKKYLYLFSTKLTSTLKETKIKVIYTI